MKTYEVLEKALALIEDEKHWTKDFYGGFERFCAEGACSQVTTGFYVPGSDKTPARLDAIDALQTILDGPVHDFNDTHTHAEVVALFQRAIRAEKQKAGIPVELPVEEAVAA